MKGKTIYGVTPTVEASLMCKRCGGRVIEDEIYKENGKKYQDLICLLCCEHFYLLISDWNKIKNKMENIILERRRLRLIEEQDSLKDREGKVLSDA